MKARITFGVICSIGLLALSGPVVAATFTWDGGGGNNNLNTSANWVGDVAPGVTGQDIIFAGATRTTPSNNYSGLSVVSVTFASGASSFTLGGNSFTVGSGGITNSSSNLQTISPELTVSTSQVFDAGTGGLSFGNKVNVATNQTLTVTGSGNTTITGAVAGSGANLTKTGTGMLTLNASSGYTGTTTILGGTLKLGLLGLIAATDPIQVGADNTSSSAVFDGSSVSGGYKVFSGQTLKGTGSIIGATTVTSGGKLAPGGSTNPGNLTVNNTVTVNSGGSLEFRINGATAGDGSSANSYDRLTITSGNLVLATAAELDFAGGYAHGLSDQLLVVNNTGAGTISIGGSSSGTFIRNIGGFGWFVHYGAAADAYGGTGGNDIVLTPVPEPTQLFAVGLGVIAVGGFMRRRLRRTEPTETAAV